MEVKDKEGDLYHIEYADGNDDHLTYAEIVNMLNKETEDGYHLWTFKEILNHRKTTRDGKQLMEVEVLWDTGEKSWEPLSTIKVDDPITVAKYVEKKGLVNKPQWKWANRYLKNKKKFLRLCRQVFLSRRRNGPTYKFGVRVPRDMKEALLIDQQESQTFGRKQLQKR